MYYTLSHFVSEAAYLIMQFKDEQDLRGEIEVGDKSYSIKVLFDLEKVEIKSFGSGRDYLPLPSWKSDFEKVFLILLRGQAREIAAEKAEEKRLEYERMNQIYLNKTTNWGGTIPGY